MAEEQQRLLEARISVLERQVQFLMRVNGIELSALRDISDDRLLKYYRDAVQLLGFQGRDFPPEVIERWSELFCQLSEFEVTRLQNMVDYEHTWEPFYYLCTRMQTSVRQHREFTTDLGLQHLYGLLDRARKNIRDVAVITIKNHPDTAPPKARALLSEETALLPL